MSFVKDDHSYTRGVGAVAAMDAVSSRRRRAAARGGRRMARKDAIMSRHTLGRIAQIDPGDGGGGSGGGGSTGGGTRPPPTRPPSRLPVRPIVGIALPPKTPIKVPIKPGIRDVIGPRLDLAVGVRGTRPIIADPIKTPGAPVVQVTPDAAPPPKEQVLPPPRPVITVVAQPGSPITGGGRPAPPPPPTFPGFAPEPEVDVEVSTPAAPVVPAKSSNSKLLLYAAIGIGAYWLLTRKG